jgi:hypothetical protein
MQGFIRAATAQRLFYTSLGAALLSNCPDLHQNCCSCSSSVNADTGCAVFFEGVVRRFWSGDGSKENVGKDEEHELDVVALRVAHVL